MIRSLPYGFNYAIPPTRPVGGYDGPDGEPGQLPPWNRTDQSQWRGFNCVLRELKTREYHILELVVDVCTLMTELNYRLFDDPSCIQYQQLTKLLRRPGLRRLDLALTTKEDYYRDWTCLRSGLLHRALSEAKDLRHITFCAFHHGSAFEDCTEKRSPASQKVFTPLRTFLPIDRWERLQHFGLSNLLERQDDLLSVIEELPSSLPSLELSLLAFLDGGSHREFLKDLHRRASWGARSPRPKFTITIHCRDGMYQYFKVDAQLYKFLHNGGDNPFSESHKKWSSIELDGCGIVGDAFDPEYDRP